MKSCIFSCGKGTRFYHLCKAIFKQLVLVYNNPVIKTDLLTAEYNKYIINTFFASKLLIFYQLCRLVNHFREDRETALYGFVSNQKASVSHLNLPVTVRKISFGLLIFQMI